MPRMTGNAVTIGSSVNNNYFFIDWSSSDEPGNNRTYISWAAYFHYTSSDAQLDNGSANLNGTRWANSGRVYNYAANFTTRDLLLASGAFYVDHNSVGEATLSVSGGVTVVGGVRSEGSASWSLTNYNRSPGTPAAPTLSRNAAGTTLNITSAVPSSPITITDYQWASSTTSGTTGFGGWNDFGTGATLSGSTSVLKTTNYWIITRAGNADGYGGSSTATYSSGFTSAPQNLTCTPSSSVSGRISLAWTGPSTTNGGVTGYRIYRKLSTDASFPSTPTATTTGTGTSYVDDGLSRGVLYDYRIAARNAASDAASGESDFSNTVSSVMAPGVPTAPTLDSVVASTDTFGKVTLSWTKPTNTAGGIVDYYLYADGVVVASVTGENTLTGNITGLNQRQTYSFTVRARNQFAIDNGLTGDASNAISRKSPGPPSAPLNLTSEAPFFPPGTIDLDWDAPVDVGTEGGTITGYSIYLAGQSTPIKTTFGTDTFTTIDDLIPATSYTFTVRARNEIADVVGTFSVASNSTTATAQGEPDAPTNFVVAPDPIVAGRLILTWTPPVGYNTGFRVYTADNVLIANVATPRLEIDGLIPATTYSYKVRARNPLTDLTGSEGGPFSATVSGIAGGTSNQTTQPLSVSNTTNNTFVGTHTIVSTTSTTMSYSRTASAIPFASVPSGAGSTTNNTNTNLNGTFTITAASPTAITYTQSGSNILADTATPGGTMTNNTNAIFNGNYTVVDADSGAKTVSYNKNNANISSRSASGTVVNNSNAIYNGIYEITDVTNNEIYYERVNTNIAETEAFGVVSNKTNSDIFNGQFEVSETPDYRTVEYVTGDLVYSENLITNPSFEYVNSGTTTLRTNLVPNPSFETNITGWTGYNANVARNSAQKFVGNNSLQVSPTSIGGGTYFTLATTPSLDYSLSAMVYSEQTMQIGVTSNLSTYSLSTVEAKTWTKITWSFFPSASTTDIYITAYDSVLPFYVDAVLVEQTVGPLGPYFDGSLADELGWGYEWSGTAHASTSLAKALSVSGSAQPKDYVTDVSTALYTPDRSTFSGAGNYTYKLTFSSDSQSISYTAQTEVGKQYVFSAWVMSVTAGTIYVKAVAGTTESAPQARVFTQNGRISVAFTATDTTTVLAIKLANGTTSAVIHTDAWMLQEGSVASSYFDGSIDDTNTTWPVVYTWAGAPHDSISIREVGGTLPESGAELLPPYGSAARVASDATLQIQYRSGWLG